MKNLQKIAVVEGRNGRLNVNYYASKKEAMRNGITFKNAKFEEQTEYFNYVSLFNFQSEREDQIELDDNCKVAYFYYHDELCNIETE